MNYIKHLSGFFDKVSKDDRLNPTHISLYISLFQFWNACRFHNPISISRNEIMKVSKICSKVTYHKCIRELHNYGYLSYHPSYNPFKGSLVYLFDFRTGTKQAVDGEGIKNETSAEQALIPYINNTNISKHKTEINEREHTQKNATEDISEKKKVQEKKKVSRKKKSDQDSLTQKTKKTKVGKSDFVIPEITAVKEYFASQNFPVIEADKFFNHFTSNGWLVSGKTPMQNWQAAGNKWMLNNQKYTQQPSKISHLYATTGKNYNEAL